MATVPAVQQRGLGASTVAISGALVLLTATLWLNAPALNVAPLVAAVALIAVGHRVLLQWHALLATLIVVILFIPIRRYELPGSLPFSLEPYRLLVALIFAGWLAALLVDGRVRLRGTGLDGPVALIAAGALGSIVANAGRVAGLSSDVMKELTFLASFLLLLYLFASVVRRTETVEFLVKLLVGGGTIVAVLGLVESNTGFNIFNQLGGVVPLLEVVAIPEADTRGGRMRVFASAQHPIALGAALVMILPFAVYLGRHAKRGRSWWWLSAALLMLGAFATVSRTGILMLVVVGFTFYKLRPVETKRVLPILLPVLVVAQLALPGALGTLKRSFFPSGGLIAEQAGAAGTRGSGRVADLGPSLAEFARTPVFGQGLGTRIVDEERQNAAILDNQWLRSLLEVGLVGVLGWLALFVRSVRRLARAAKGDDSPRGWLNTALAASISAFAVGMFTYDAFSFIQVTFLLFLLIGFAAVLLREQEPEGESAATAERFARA